MTMIPIPTDAKAMHGPRQGEWTRADWEALREDGNRYEIINGVLYMTTAPSYFHQWIIRRLLRLVGDPAEDKGLGLAIFAPIGVFMPNCDPVQPDFVFVSTAKLSIINDGAIHGVPDLIVEVLSPGNTAYDERIKLAAYAGAGLPEYAIVSPSARALSLHKLEVVGRYHPPQVFKEAEMVTFACLPEITFAVNELFAGSPDTTL
jgi:Uma2 family endonuclease